MRYIRLTHYPHPISPTSHYRPRTRDQTPGARAASALTALTTGLVSLAEAGHNQAHLLRREKEGGVCRRGRMSSLRIFTIETPRMPAGANELSNITYLSPHPNLYTSDLLIPSTPNISTSRSRKANTRGVEKEEIVEGVKQGGKRGGKSRRERKGRDSR